MKINEQWEELKEDSHANIQSEKGILKRQICSIQTEGHFGDVKENEKFRRFNYRSSGKGYKEFMLYAIGRNINKYHRFLQGELQNTKEKATRKQLRQRSVPKYGNKGILRPKISSKRKSKKLLWKSQVLKSTGFHRSFLFFGEGPKNRY